MRSWAPSCGRASYVKAALLAIGLGLGVHYGGTAFDPVVRDVLGDLLWSVMVTWLLGAIAPRLQLGPKAAVALLCCFAVEFSQLVHVAWLDQIRRSRLGHLVLGSGFVPRDLLAYGAGVLLATALEWLCRRRRVAGP